MINPKKTRARNKVDKADNYLARLSWEGSKLEGIKIGYAKDASRRVKNFRTQAFAFPKTCTLVCSQTFSNEVAQKLEKMLKLEFFHCRDSRFPDNREIFETEVFEKMSWALTATSQSPLRVREIAWRAANLPLNLAGKPRLEIFRSDGPETGRHLTRKISDLTRARYPKADINSELLDSGLAHAACAIETPFSIVLIYHFFLKITDDLPCFDNVSTPEWRAGVHLGIKCATLFTYDREEFEDACASAAELTDAMGFFGVRFLEVFSKSFHAHSRPRHARKKARRARKMKVTMSCGRPLSRAMRDEILAATFSDNSRIDVCFEQLEEPSMW